MGFNFTLSLIFCENTLASRLTVLADTLQEWTSKSMILCTFES